jgi:siroheme synthase
MDDNCFDALVQSLAAPGTRRAVVRLVAGALAILGLDAATADAARSHHRPPRVIAHATSIPARPD